MLVVVICFVIALVSVFIYAFLAGCTGEWLHNYLLATSKASQFSHDHRMCVFVSICWPFPLIFLGCYYMCKAVKITYDYPHKLFLAAKNRKNKIQK